MSITSVMSIQATLNRFSLTARWSAVCPLFCSGAFILAPPSTSKRRQRSPSLLTARWSGWRPNEHKHILLPQTTQEQQRWPVTVLYHDNLTCWPGGCGILPGVSTRGEASLCLHSVLPSGGGCVHLCPPGWGRPPPSTTALPPSVDALSPPGEGESNGVESEGDVRGALHDTLSKLTT